MVTVEKRAERGVPSLVWRAGQERRLKMIKEWTATQDTFILVDGCGLGAYSAHLLKDTPHVYNFDIEIDRVEQALQVAPLTHLAAAEALPYPQDSFDTILSHEVIEHVLDDRESIAEMVRTLKPGGRIIIFCPNRWYPFETHGHYWRGNYHFGNTPLINYLPTPLRDKLAPHVRAYTKRQLLSLFDGLPTKVVHHTRIFGAYDNIIKRSPTVGNFLRTVLQAAEKTPLRLFGLSHLLVVEKTAHD